MLGCRYIGGGASGPEPCTMAPDGEVAGKTHRRYRIESGPRRAFGRSAGTERERREMGMARNGAGTEQGRHRTGTAPNGDGAERGWHCKNHQKSPESLKERSTSDSVCSTVLLSSRRRTGKPECKKAL